MNDIIAGKPCRSSGRAHARRVRSQGRGRGPRDHGRRALCALHSVGNGRGGAGRGPRLLRPPVPAEDPPDLELIPLSQVFGGERLVEEFVVRFAHTLAMDWMLPGVAPTAARSSSPWRLSSDSGTAGSPTSTSPGTRPPFLASLACSIIPSRGPGRSARRGF